MFISVTEGQKKHMAGAGSAYLKATLFCALFGAIYEHFSHGVYSGYMIFAFLFPLIGGFLPFLIMSRSGWRRLPGRLPLNLYHSGLAALTVGSIFQGVLAIYGTTSSLTKVYWICGFGLAVAGGVLYLIGLLAERNSA